MFEVIKVFFTESDQNVLLAALLFSLGYLLIFIINGLRMKKNNKREREGEFYLFSNGKINAYNTVILSLKKALSNPLCNDRRNDVKGKYELYGYELPIEVSTDVENFITNDVDNPFAEKKREKLLKKALLQLEKEKRTLQLINHKFVEKEKRSHTWSRKFVTATSWFVFYYLLIFIIFLAGITYLNEKEIIEIEVTNDGSFQNPFFNFFAVSSITLALLSIVIVVSFSLFKVDRMLKGLTNVLKNKPNSKEEYVLEGQNGYYICSICKKRQYLEEYDKFPGCKWDIKHSFGTLFKDTTYAWKQEKKKG
ncbi:hypothetical protein K7887_22655 (plasmid) [Sutcliffiella horikoshii]|uniref:hypothetical protein n=1 Tax=Sutcliffiella horikoshii TaxID=79883 RepID=UPI001CBB7193|nr:hypothetical protein [Sutcliffiella horikoshii]UAL49770.1 hypothetical protein K7887_22655 [Sutcliffiella horikoshii]